MNKKAMLMVVCLLCTGLFTSDTLQALELADLPSAVQETIKRELGGVSPEKIERDTDDGEVVYMVRLFTRSMRRRPMAERSTLRWLKTERCWRNRKKSGSQTCPRRYDVPTGLQITIGGKPFASYYTGTSKIPRPYFANVKTPSGIQVSRNHPPIEGKDSTDHSTYHPGVWLTFAGINGNDYWRLKKKTEHEMFIGKPRGGPGRGTFTVSNFYLDSLDSSGNRVAHEICKYTIVARPSYYLLIYDSTIWSDEHDLVFGDDQEYGLGIRVQTPIEERYGGRILNADGLEGAEKLYGKASDWCDYSGVMDDTLIGMTVMPDPRNFRRSWFHARDYGLIAANPFGRKGVAGGKKSEVLVKKGEKFHLGFGIAIYSAPKGGKVDRDAMYTDYLKQIGAKN